MKSAMVLVLLMFVAGACRKPPKEITRAEARRLLLVALRKTDPAWLRLPKFGVAHYSDPYFPSFDFFEVTWNNPKGSVILGHYAVNPKTADIWEAIGCHRLEPAAIRPLQQALRRKIKLSKKEYRKLSKETPCSPARPALGP